MQEDLLIGTKEILLGEFDELYPVYGRKWRGELKKMNPWHNTATGLVAWRNISNRTTGNETLRLIVGDMRAIAAGALSPKASLPKRQGLVRKNAPSLQEKYPKAAKALGDAQKRRAALSKKK
jgi:hypothetical protein